MAKIYLHVGTHKTGTTSIQSLAARSRAQLSAEGLSYPNAIEWFKADPRLQSSNAHFSFANALARFNRKDQRQLAAFRDHLAAELTTGKDVLISAESLYRHILDNQGDPLKKGTAQDRRQIWRRAREAFVARLADFFDGLTVEVVMYLRRPDSFIESLYSESIVSTGNKQAFKKFLRKYEMRFDYRDEIDPFSRNWDLKLFDFETRKKDMPLGFFKSLDLPLPHVNDQEAKRASVPKAAVLWLCTAKTDRSIPSQELKRRWIFALQTENKGFFHADRPSTFWHNTTQRQKFLEQAGLSFRDITFDTPSPLPDTCTWSEAEQADAEVRFAIWEDRNAEWLADREANRVPMFINPQAPS